VSALPGDFVALYLRLPPEKIVLLKAILESYDELGIIRTIDKKLGDVAVLSLPGLKAELELLLQSLKAELEISFKEPPNDLGPDWFLSEV